MTHEYTILTGGTVIRGGGLPDATAIAWAHDTVLLVGTDDEARSISRGDSNFVDVHGAVVFPMGEATLETGSPADFAVLASDPRGVIGQPATLALVRGGRVVEGSLDRYRLSTP